MAEPLERSAPVKESGATFDRPLVDFSRFDKIINAGGKPADTQKPGDTPKPADNRPGIDPKPGADARPVSGEKPGQAKPGSADTKPATDTKPGSSNTKPAADTKPGTDTKPGSANTKPGADTKPGSSEKPVVAHPTLPPFLPPFDTRPPLDRLQPPPQDTKPAPFTPPSPQDTKPLQPKPELPVKPIVVPPINEITKPQQATDQTARKITPGPDGKLVITEKDFDLIGPKAAEVLKQAGVSKITVTPGKDSDTYEAEFKKPLEVPQDPDVDGCRKLKVADKFKADVVKNADGSFELRNIQGLTAESKVLFKWRDASVDKVILKKLPDGQSEITSTGSWNGFSKDQTRTKPGDIFDKASTLFERMIKIKEASSPAQKQGSPSTPSYLEIPRIK